MEKLTTVKWEVFLCSNSHKENINMPLYLLLAFFNHLLQEAYAGYKKVSGFV